MKTDGPGYAHMQSRPCTQSLPHSATLSTLCSGPEGGTLRLMLLGELMSAAGFQRDRLYIEWQLRYDPGLWILQHNEQELVQPGIIQGVSHVSRMVQYPADPSTDSPAVWVAHFAHPLEVEWVAKAAPNPKDWPHLLLQVCTYDLWDRFTTEGYGWLQLTGWPGSRTQYVETWKPLGELLAVSTGRNW
eukprot:GHRR01037099.1.p1 GENE.GHRR01037099.1~~GHRR01037099.1.p1  ORF type:complete len:188 (+),score=43.64 GHRR01037099.1:416-979(+)